MVFDVCKIRNICNVRYKFQSRLRYMYISTTNVKKKDKNITMINNDQYKNTF